MGAPIREELVLADSFSQTFRNFDAAANAAINVAEEFQKTLNQFSEGFLDGLVSSLQESRDELGRMADGAEDVKDAYRGVEDIIRKTTGGINDNTDAQDKFNESVRRSEKSAGNLMGTISKIAGAVGVVKLAENFIETSDEMSQITAKLNLINDGFQTTEELQQRIFESAQRTRSSYQDTAQLIARIGMNTGDTFKSNAEMVLFAENLNKSFQVAGASAQEQSSVILQLSQALAGGLLRGQEFNAVMSGAPNIIKNIADYMGVTVGEMRDLAAEGQITSEIIRNAMLGATKNIDAQFKTLPKTFSGITTQLKNQIDNSLGKAFDEWINRLNSEETEDTINNLADMLSNLAVKGANAFMDIASAASGVITVIEAIEPALITAGVAVGTYKLLHINAAAAVEKAWAAVNTTIGGIAVGAGLVAGGIAVTENLIDNNKDVNNAKKSGLLDPFNSIEKDIAKWSLYAYDTGMVSSQLGNSLTRAMSGKKDTKAVSTDPVQGKVSNLITSHNWYSEYYGSRYTPNDELFMKTLPATQAALKAEQEKDALFAMYVDEINANRKEEEERNKALEDIKDNGVKVKNEVKLSDEDLQIFRDIAENRYIANVSLETLAPSVSVNVENNGQNLSEDDIASAVTRAIETQISERTAISHG